MRVVYMGTPDFAVPALHEIIKHHEVVAVLTQPDRPAGRGHKLTPSPVKVAALENNIEVLQPETLKIRKGEQNPSVQEYRAKLKSFDADIFVVAAYGLILPKAVLDIPRLGCINIHASLLPKYRGASPIHAALLNGDKETGITIMHMDVGLDTGDMILKRSAAIDSSDNLPKLHDKMAELGGQCIIEALALLENGTADRVPQNDAESCYAPMIKKTDGLINWADSSDTIINKLRAFDPWPGIYTMYGELMLKIWGLEAAENHGDSSAPGTIICADATNGLVIKTGDGALRVTEIQPHGKKRMGAADYLRGAKLDTEVQL